MICFLIQTSIRSEFFEHFNLFISLTLFTLAYVTYQDIRKISGLKDQTVIVVRAPPETRLEVPDPVEVCVMNNF